MCPDKLKSQIEKYRISRKLHEGTSLSSASENEKEEELKKEMKTERSRFILVHITKIFFLIQ